MRLDVRRVGPEAASVLLAIVQEAFGSRPALDPPADALVETEATLAERLRAHPGLLACLDDEPVGCVLLDPGPDALFLRRFGVTAAARHHGVAQALVGAAEDEALAAGTHDELAVVAREELPDTIRFWEHRGFVEVARSSPLVELRRPVRSARIATPGADDMRSLGSRIAGLLRRGDLLVLTGELGAGKTTLTQGLGAGLEVRGAVTSPTFVIARVHPSEGDGPALVHVDAYRLGGLAELDDLDLDTSLEEAVTVVEWGEGVAEVLADSRLAVRILRDRAAPEGDLDPRTVEVIGYGPRWRSVDLAGALATPGGVS